MVHTLGETNRFKAIERNIEIIGQDLVGLHGFTMVPNFILTNPNLSGEAKLFYSMLLKYARENDYCFPGQQRLAKDMGCSDRSLRRYQEELVKEGVLQVSQRGLGKTNLYRLDLTVQRKGKPK